MKVNRWFGLIASVILLVSVANPMGVQAEADRTLADESIYDLLVDRFNNGDGNNDMGANAQIPEGFNGGDFTGIITRLQHILDMGFTVVSLGPVFPTESYDGRKALDYTGVDPHFGTIDEFNGMIKELHGKNLKVMVDFPLGGVSANHEWTKEGKLKTFPAADGTIDWDPADAEVQQTLKSAIVAFVETHKLDGIRLTQIDEYDDAFLNDVIAAVKQVQPKAYVLTDVESTANFDSMPNTEKMNVMREAFSAFDLDTSPLAIITGENNTELIQYDDLTGSRFTFDIVEKRMFPPTRWKMAAVALFTLPGVPIMPYGTEIAVNGETAPEIHPYMNFKTDMELKDLIGDLNKLRNQTATLRTGDFEMLHNDNGFLVYKWSTDEEAFIVAVNNKSKTSNMEIPGELIGEKKLLRGLLDGDLIKQSDDGIFRVVLEREVAEIYFVSEDKGFNTPYLIASILVYVLFLGFLFSVWKKGRQSKA